MSDELLRLTIRVEHDVFAVRQRGREVGARVGLADRDVIRLAAALSEVGRQLFARLGPVTVVFATGRDPEAVLEVTASAAVPRGFAGTGELAGELGSVRRLVDGWRVEQVADRVIVQMTRRLPAAGPPVPLAPAADAVRAEELERLYHELTEELAETNRGVLALYAELDRRTAELAQANEAKNRFLANVSHELRAPVTAILGLVRLLRDPGSDPLTDEQQRQLALLHDSADTMLGLVNELLDLAKVESGRLEPRWSTVDLHALFGALRGTMRSIAAQGDPARPGVEVIVEEPVSVPVVRTDEAMLTQVLRNLMTNAIKFTERGEVRLAAQPAGADRVAFTVTDTGIGIPAGEHERIFEEFYQVPGAAQANVTGTGLGLPYARQLVALLRGELTLASEVGKGSTFTVTLPLVPQRSEDPA